MKIRKQLFQSFIIKINYRFIGFVFRRTKNKIQS